MSDPWDVELVAILRAQAEDDQSQYGREAKTEAADEIERLGTEVERLRSGIREHRDQKSDDRCWLDDLSLYAILGDGEERKAELTLPARAEFLASCERYWAQRQNHNAPALGCMTIRQLEGTVERLTSERDELLAACRAFLARYHNKMVDARFVFGDVAGQIEAAIAKATGEPDR